MLGKRDSGTDGEAAPMFVPIHTEVLFLGPFTDPLGEANFKLVHYDFVTSATSVFLYRA